MHRLVFLFFTIFLLSLSFFGCSNSEKKDNNKLLSNSQLIISDLYNFSVNTNEPNKIYFDSKNNISSVDIDKFIIQDHYGIKILSSTIKKGTENHFLTVEKPLYWYHNNTISYLGDSTIKPFQLQFIQNNIAIPKINGKQYYVNASVNISGNGLNEATAFKTIQEGVDILKAGDKLWIKTGNYRNENIVVQKSGKASNPIQIEGYMNNPGDISKMYYNYGDGNLNPNKMPLLDGGNRAKGTAFMLDNNVHYIIIKNIQITNYHKGFFGRVNTGKVRLERFLIKNMGDGENGAKYGAGVLLETWDDNTCNYFKVKDCIVINAEEVGIASKGDNNYYENCKVYSNEYNQDEKYYMEKATDYYFRTQGIGNIIRGCKAHKKTALGHYGHGFSMKYRNEYNLVENCEAINIKWAYQARHSVCRYNVFRNSIARADVSYRRRDQFDSYTGGINIMSGANHNIFEDIYIHDTDLVFDFYKNGEDNKNSTDIGHDNIFKNIKAKNIVHQVISLGNSEASKASFNDNIFYNLTIENVNYEEQELKESKIDNGTIQGAFFLWNPKGNVIAKGNEIINSTIKNTPKLNVFTHYPLPSGFIWKNINLENSFKEPQ